MKDKAWERKHTAITFLLFAESLKIESGLEMESEEVKQDAGLPFL
jgi:hypothetical protein